VVCGLALAALLLLLEGCGSSQGVEDPWKRQSEILRGLRVESVEIRANGPRRVVLGGEEARGFVDALLAGTFNEDNPFNFGPTASVVVLYHYTDGTVFSVPQWPDGRFQIQETGKGQYLIASPSLAGLLLDRGFVASD